MSIYDSCKSGIIQRGEGIFPLPDFDPEKDWEEIRRKLYHIPLNGERFMTSDEVLMLYD